MNKEIVSKFIFAMSSNHEYGWGYYTDKNMKKIISNLFRLYRDDLEKEELEFILSCDKDGIFEKIIESDEKSLSKLEKKKMYFFLGWGKSIEVVPNMEGTYNIGNISFENFCCEDFEKIIKTVATVMGLPQTGFEVRSKEVLPKQLEEKVDEKGLIKYLKQKLER